MHWLDDSFIFYRLVIAICISISVLIYFVAANITDPCNDFKLQRGLPRYWPCEWNNGRIPFAYNFYDLNPNRLVNVVHRGIRHVESKSCLRFIEHNPVELARRKNVTYLFFTFSDVLEYCCLPVSSFYRRRVVLITPLCTLPVQVAHAILHSMGLVHDKRKPFPAQAAIRVLECKNVTNSTDYKNV